MKAKLIILTLLAGCIGMVTQAQISDAFAGPNGYMNVFDNSGGGQGGYVFGAGWGVADLQALTSDGVTFELLPNTNTYNPDDPFWSDGEGGGNKWMEANCFYEANPIGFGKTNVIFTFTVDANDLSDTNYTCQGFIKLLDPNNNYNQVAIELTNITSTGTYTLEKELLFGDNDLLAQAGWVMSGLNANPTSDWGSVTVTITELTLADNDDTAPMPDPLTWDTVPAGVSGAAISMIASTATDSNGVEYLFQNVTLGHDSGWLSTNEWTDTTGLSPLTPYDYRVKARDKSSQNNETGWSSTETGVTLAADLNPPTPNPMTFADSEVSPISIKLTATTATDDQSAVEYLFTCVTDGSLSSTWQSSTNYAIAGLTPGANYTFNVKARDLNGNETAASANLALVTPAVPNAHSLTNDLQGFTGNTDQASTLHELAMIGLTTGSTNPDATISFDAEGATFGEGVGFSGRNLLKTIATNYNEASFVAYATLTFSGAGDLSGYIGMGQGIQTGVPDNYGVPELNLAGVNGVVAEFKDTTAGSGVYNTSLFKFVSGSPAVEDGGEQILTAPVVSTNTIRAKIVYSAESNSVFITIDSDYTGGAFEPDQNLGTVSTLLTNGVSMWTNAPVRVYVGGGEGTIVKDFEITTEGGTTPVIGVNDLIIIPVSGGVALQWTSVAGQTYDVKYKTSLTGGSWTTDPSPGCSGVSGTGGSLSATSTIGSDTAFYQVSTELE